MSCLVTKMVKEEGEGATTGTDIELQPSKITKMSEQVSIDIDLQASKVAKMSEEVSKADAPATGSSPKVLSTMTLPTTVKQQQRRRRNVKEKDVTTAGCVPVETQTVKTTPQKRGKQTKKPPVPKYGPKAEPTVTMGAVALALHQQAGDGGVGTRAQTIGLVGGGIPQNPPLTQENQQQQLYSGMSNLNSCNPLVWVGMKDIRDADIYGVLELNWESKMTLVAWAPHRIMVASPENDAFIRMFNNPPWRDQGNVVFFCAEGKVVRCHAVLLYGILPFFTKQLLEMQNFSFNQYVKDLPYIPICLMGIEQQIVNHLVNLMNQGVDYLTGKEVAQLKKVMELLNLTELVICIAPTDMNMNDFLAGGKNVPPGPAAPGPEVTNPPPPTPFISLLLEMGSQLHQETAQPQPARFNGEQADSDGRSSSTAV